MSHSKRKGPTYRVELSVDGERIPIKPFIHDLIGGTLSGMVEGLKDGERGEEIAIRVTRRDDDASA